MKTLLFLSYLLAPTYAFSQIAPVGHVWMPKIFINELVRNGRTEAFSNQPIKSILIDHNQVYTSTPGTEYSLVKLKKVRTDYFLLSGVQYNLAVQGMKKYFYNKSKIYLDMPNGKKPMCLVVVSGGNTKKILFTDSIGNDKIYEQDLVFFQAMLNRNISYIVQDNKNTVVDSLKKVIGGSSLIDKDKKVIQYIKISKFINVPCLKTSDSLLMTTTVNVLATCKVRNKPQVVILAIRNPFRKYFIDVFSYDKKLLDLDTCAPKFIFRLIPKPN